MIIHTSIVAALKAALGRSSNGRPYEMSVRCESDGTVAVTDGHLLLYGAGADPLDVADYPTEPLGHTLDPRAPVEAAVPLAALVTAAKATPRHAVVPVLQHVVVTADPPSDPSVPYAVPTVTVAATDLQSWHEARVDTVGQYPSWRRLVEKEAARAPVLRVRLGGKLLAKLAAAAVAVDTDVELTFTHDPDPDTRDYTDAIRVRFLAAGALENARLAGLMMPIMPARPTARVTQQQAQQQGPRLGSPRPRPRPRPTQAPAGPPIPTADEREDWDRDLDPEIHATNGDT